MSMEGLTLSVEHAVGTGMVTYNKFFHTCGAAAPACEWLTWDEGSEPAHMALKNVIPSSKLSTFEGQLSRNEPIAADKNVFKQTRCRLFSAWV